MEHREENVCELCKRHGVKISAHHLIPKEYGGREFDIVYLCEPCHKQIHALYTNREIGARLYSMERLKNDEKIKKFLKWIKKQPSDTSVNIKKSRERRKHK